MRKTFTLIFFGLRLKRFFRIRKKEIKSFQIRINNTNSDKSNPSNILTESNSVGTFCYPGNCPPYTLNSTIGSGIVPVPDQEPDPLGPAIIWPQGYGSGACPFLPKTWKFLMKSCQTEKKFLNNLNS